MQILADVGRIVRKHHASVTSGVGVEFVGCSYKAQFKNRIRAQ